jgi:hypothetical protein
MLPDGAAIAAARLDDGRHDVPVHADTIVGKAVPHRAMSCCIAFAVIWRPELVAGAMSVLDDLNAQRRSNEIVLVHCTVKCYRSGIVDECVFTRPSRRVFYCQLSPVRALRARHISAERTLSSIVFFGTRMPRDELRRDQNVKTNRTHELVNLLLLQTNDRCLQASVRLIFPDLAGKNECN